MVSVSKERGLARFVGVEDGSEGAGGMCADFETRVASPDVV